LIASPIRHLSQGQIVAEAEGGAVVATEVEEATTTREAATTTREVATTTTEGEVETLTTRGIDQEAEAAMTTKTNGAEVVATMTTKGIVQEAEVAMTTVTNGAEAVPMIQKAIEEEAEVVVATEAEETTMMAGKRSTPTHSKTQMIQTTTRGMEKRRQRKKQMVASLTQAEVGAQVNTVAEVNIVVEASIVAEASIEEEAITMAQASIAEEVNIAEEVREVDTVVVAASAKTSKRKMKRHSELSLPRTSNSTTKTLVKKDPHALPTPVEEVAKVTVAKEEAVAEATMSSSLKRADKATRTT
jgi:hypothetical protein